VNPAISTNKTKTAKYPTVSIIGAGRLGTALAIALDSCGYRIEALVARRPGHARKASKLISGNCQSLSEDQLEKLPDSALFLIATPDDAISGVATSLAKAKSSNPQRTVLHTSGALSSEVLEPLAARGFHTGSLHPLVSISDPKQGAGALGSAFFCVEGDKGALKVAKQIVKDLGARSFSIESHQKALYHAAAVMSSGHITALFDVTIEMLTQCGLDQATAQKVLLPLLESTWRNLTSSAPFEALTGTYARGDAETVKRHLAALAATDNAETLAAYKLLGRRSLKLLAQNGGDLAVIKRIAGMLNQR